MQTYRTYFGCISKSTEIDYICEKYVADYTYSSELFKNSKVLHISSISLIPGRKIKIELLFAELGLEFKVKAFSCCSILAITIISFKANVYISVEIPGSAKSICILLKQQQKKDNLIKII